MSTGWCFKHIFDSYPPSLVYLFYCQLYTFIANMYQFVFYTDVVIQTIYFSNYVEIQPPKYIG